MKYIIITITLMLLTCCDPSNTKEASIKKTKRELTIYCENAMVPSLMKLKEKFESGNNCIVTLHNDCSQNLSSLIQYNQAGDIYLPASIAGFKKLRNKHRTYIIDSVFIGYNTLAVMALKGNPTGYDGTLEKLIDKKHAVIIANPETSSLGFDTQRLLVNKELYDDVLLNVVALSTDSRGLVKSLINKEAQLIINWKSDLYNNGNRHEVEVFDISNDQQAPSEIYAGILSTSKYPELAKDFLDYATSEQGITLFRKYGFTRRKTLIF